MATAVATQGAKGAKRDVPFSWTGMDKKGNRVSGKSLAPDETALRADLRRQGIAVTKIKKQATAFKSGGKVNAEDIAVFSRQLATMLAAGIPLVQSFEIVGNGNDKPAMQKLILDIKADVEGGTSLHEALGKHPLYFDDLFVNLVEAGEQAGALETLLKDFGLADHPKFAQAKGRGIRALSGHIESTDVTNDVNGGPSGVGIATAAGKEKIRGLTGWTAAPANADA